MWSRLRRVFLHLPGQENGQDLAEYAMLISLIALVVIVGVTFFGAQLSQTITDIGTLVRDWAS